MRRKLIAIFLVFPVILIVVGGVLSYEQIAAGLKRADRSAARTAGILAHTLELQMLPGDSSLVGSTRLDKLIRYLGTEYSFGMIVVDRGMKIVGGAEEHGRGEEYSGGRDSVKATLTDGSVRRFEAPGMGGEKDRWVVVPIRASDRTVTGAVLLDASGAFKESTRLILEVNGTITVTILLTVVLSILLAGILSRKFTLQVRELENGVREIDGGNWNVRIDERGKDELGKLAGAFNRMASDLQRSKDELDHNVAALRENELRLRLVVRASHDMIWETELKSGVSEWSDALRSFLGYRRDGLKPTVDFWKGHIHPEDVGRYVSITECALKNGEESWSAEYRLRRSDGSYADILDRAYVVYNEEKIPVRLVGAATDITEKKEAERRLAESESSFRLSFANNPHPMWVYDLKTLRFLEVNEAFLDMYGYSYDELMKMTLEDIHPREDVPRLRKDLERERPVLQHSGEWRHTKKNGAVVDVQIDSHVLEFMGRNAVLVIAQDITRRKEAERKLRESEVRFRTLIERSSDVVSIINSEGKIVYMSPAVSRMGYSVDDVQGSTAFDIVHPDDVGKLKRALDAIALTPGALQTFQMRFRHRDGSWRDSESIVFNALNVPEIRGIVVNSRDITEKKKLESQFLRAQRLESIGTLAGGIAHDLNNVLSPILLSLGMIRRMNLDESGKVIVDTIESSARRGADLIKQVLSFARGIEGERTLVQLRHLIEEIEKIIAQTFPKTISISAIAPKDLWPISGDVTQLHQVMMNLCVNARDAMPDGGRIEITAENVVLDEQYVHSHFETREGPYVLLSITDTGIGIPASLIDRIFEPFFTTKEEGKGTGLGLSTVITIVKSHGGAVYVYSEENKGTTFKIYLPAQTDARLGRADETLKEKYAGNGELILVVDDEAAVRNISKTILDAYGYRAIVAADGEQGLELFAANRKELSLVITDMMMPKMDGAAIIGSIRTIAPDMKIIVISGLSQNGDRQALKDVSFTLTKPFTAEKLLMTVSLALREHS